VLDAAVASPKLEAAVELVRTVLAEPTNKVIIFSFWREMLHQLAAALNRWGAVLYHGDMSPTAKMAAQSRFAHDPDCRLFLATDAGAYGTDLPVATHLVNFDLPWSAGKLRAALRPARPRRLPP
jgi:superfamily II DNA/RNA helicase